MQLHDIKISTRLIGLSVFLLLGSLILGLTGWIALSKTNALLQLTLEQAASSEEAVDTARKAQVIFKIQIQEWKNTLLRGHDMEAFAKYRDAFIKSGKETQEELGKLQTIFAKLGLDEDMVTEAKSSLAKLEFDYLDALKQFDSARLESTQAVDKLVKGMDREPTQKIDQIVAFVSEHSASIRERNQASAQKQHDLAVSSILLALLILTAAGAGLTYWIITSVTRPLNSAIAIAKTVAAGDLTADINVSSQDETGQLLSALKEMNDSLVRIVNRVRQGTDAIATGSSEIAAGNLDLSSRTEQQASALEETASSMEEITATVRQNADNAQQANQLVASASEIALRGGNVVSQVVSTMESINEASKRVVDIIAVIDGIAFQTNILALNAAVEAARAGEQGRGFAVVAAEVRGLAQRSASAAKEIKELIGNSVERVGTGEKLVTEAGATMQEVVQSVQRIIDIMAEITVASREQTSGIEQVNIAISQMDQVTQQNAALVEQAAAAAASLQKQADELALAVGRFKLG
ncbi:HAMP domain-containing protein [Methylobacillus flagellatus]|uniref:methyl-accepting chemotaxis protein n=1 Tax=Methylobacillus flagellatus TaxID=405 RepID=UPI002853AD54|nr:methyl-accepting chemotaxis protein [Methylobacillus flagellatus]MDR5170450.1 HAMP domain-containing protein [Methylobacillus flagellatus]